MTYRVKVSFEIEVGSLSEARNWMRQAVETTELTGFYSAPLLRKGENVGRIEVERVA